MVRAFYIGRFNPPHFGHLEAIKYILSQPRIDSLIIGVGSAQDSWTLVNPLTGGERIEILSSMLIEEHISNPKNYFIIPIVDVTNNNLWTSHVISLCPKFNVVYTNNSLVKLLFTNNHIPIRPIPLKNRDQWSGTIIREKIIRGEPWSDLVPPIVEKLFLKFQADKRLLELVKKDE